MLISLVRNSFSLVSFRLSVRPIHLSTIPPIKRRRKGAATSAGPSGKKNKTRMADTTERAAKKAKTEEYVLYYWPGLPGRGEYVRLAFEHAGVPYTENLNAPTLVSTLTNPGKVGHPPHFAPPALKLPSGRFISQTGAILNHIAPKFGLAGEKGSKGLEGGEEGEEERSSVNQLVLTALDLCLESHDTHHPIASEQYYEEQKEPAAARAKSYRANRLPKFFKHFQNVLASNPEADQNGGTYLIGSKTTTADLTLFHVLDGVEFAFPKRWAALKAAGQYDKVFELKERVANEKGIKEYIASGRRTKFGTGLFRHYPELDGDE